MMTRVVWIFLLFALAAVPPECTLPGTSSVTETETGEISGCVVDQDRVPFGGATVIIRHDSPAPDFMESDTTYSADDGGFSFAGLDPMEYYLEVAASEDRGSFVSVSLDSTEKKAGIGNVICTPLGKIEGKIEGKIDQSLPDAVSYLYIRTLDCMIPVDSAGFYESRNVPAGTYHLSAMEDNAVVASYFDTLAVTVSSGDTTRLAFWRDSVLFESDGSTLALWSFNDRSGSAVADLSGNGFDLTLADPAEIVSGLFSNALHLSDTGYGVLLPDMSFLTEKVTVKAVILVDSLPSEQLDPRPHAMIVSVMDFASDTDVYGYELRLTDTTGCPEFNIGTADGWKSALSPGGLETGRWYTLTGTFDGSTVSIYVNDEVMAQTSYSGVIRYPSSRLHCSVGRRYVDQPFHFSGVIDEIHISTVSP